MTENDPKKAQELNDYPRQYWTQLFRAKATALDRGYTLEEIEGKSLSEMEKFLEEHYEIRTNPKNNWKIVKDTSIPQDVIYINGFRVNISRS